MGTEPVPVHYLRPNETEWTPPCVIYLDTETRTVPRSMPEVLTLRLWCARLIDRRPTRARKQVTINGNGQNAAELVEHIDRCFIGRQTIWLFAHNLSFDLTTTRLPMALTATGWDITDAAVGGAAPWMRFAKGARRLALLDSGSWLPMKLDLVAKHLGMVKPDLPAETDSAQAWLDRCWADVDILAAAMGQILDWWDAEGLGRFNVTGASCGWNAFRHTPTGQRIVIDPAPAAVAADRAANYGGRRGVWRVGDVRVGELLELDITAAYPSTAARLPLPVQRVSPFVSMPVDDWKVTSDRWGVIAEVELETDVPRWPVRWGGAVWYPTGRFRTTLAGPEIAEAARSGALRHIGPGYLHKLGGAMMPWARWCLATQAGQNPAAPPAAELVAKHWGRAVIGKWASRSFIRTELGPSPIDGWHYEETWDNASQTRSGFVDIAGRRWYVTASAQPDNAYPGIQAWVESAVRVRLSRVIELLGPTIVVQCDTDGLIIIKDELIKWARALPKNGRTPRNDDKLIALALQTLNSGIEPLTIRVKASHSQARILGPQHVELPTGRRFSGLPKHATRTGENTYRALMWPKLQWQMTHNPGEGYMRPEVESVIAGPYAAGWVLSTGRVVPVLMRIDADGSNQVVPWDFMPRDTGDSALASIQHRLLDELNQTVRATFPLIEQGHPAHRYAV